MPNSHLDSNATSARVDDTPGYKRRHIVRYISLKLAALGLPTYDKTSTDFLGLTHGLLRSYKEKNRLLSDHLCPIDSRIQQFLDDYLAGEDLKSRPRLPGMLGASRCIHSEVPSRRQKLPKTSE